LDFPQPLSRVDRELLGLLGPRQWTDWLPARLLRRADAARERRLHTERERRCRPERAAHAHLLHCIFGNPFRPLTVSPAWQSPQVVALAQAAYEERELPAGTLDLARLAVLADVLEEAGCTGADILNQCRQPGVHVRGCWVVDLLLGKS
jgi:hypothetical protein